MSTIDDLPTELILAIFGSMDPKTMITASSTCRRWYKLYTLPEQQYKVAQHRYSVVDGPPNDEWPVSRRLAALRAHQERWYTISWVKTHTFDDDRGDQWECFSGVYGQARRFQNRITFNKAPSILTNSIETMWAIDIPIPIRDFCMDSYQDLVVVMNAERQRSRRDVHFLSMSDGRPHPRARYPMVSEDISSLWPYDHGCTIEIYGQHVIILFRGFTHLPTEIQKPGSILIVWNWTTGEKMMHLNSSSDNFIESFCFLSLDHVLVGRRAISSATDVQPSLETYYFGEGLEHVTMRRFRLPQTQIDMHLISLELLSQAVPTPNPDAWRPFYTSPSNRICMITAVYSRGHSHRWHSQRWVNYITFTSIFLKTFPNEDIHSEPVDIDGFRHVSTVSWNNWNPHVCVTGWISERDVFKAVTCGTRMVRLIGTDALQRHRVQICDFNPYAYSQAKKALLSDEKEVGTKTQTKQTDTDLDQVLLAEWEDAENRAATPQYRFIDSTHFPLDSMFTEPVVSALPYLETTKMVEDVDISFVMMDFENLYLLSEDKICVLSF